MPPGGYSGPRTASISISHSAVTPLGVPRPISPTSGEATYRGGNLILLDTNVVSELCRPSPAPAVEAYLLALPSDAIFTTTISLAEIRYGLARMPPGRRRESLSARVAAFVDGVLVAQILPFDAACTTPYGEIRASREAMGAPVSTEDAMIAAIAKVNGALLATRNVKDFAHCGIKLVDPWSA